MAHRFVEHVITALDINVLDNTSPVTDEFLDVQTLSIDVQLASGTLGTAVLEFQCSADGSNNWTTITKQDLTTAIAITTVGLYTDIDGFKTKFCRFKVTTAEGGVGTVNIIIQGKK